MSTRGGFVRTWIGGVLIAACAPGLPRPSGADTVFAHERRPSATLADLEHGRSLYVRRCAGCHTLKDPGAVKADLWPVKIADMQREHDVQLGAGEPDLIANYLYAMSRRASVR
jgi:mono/diheme cytochrome c family protein